MIEQYEESIDAYKKALALRETSVCHFNLAVTYADKGDNDLAIQHYKAAIELDEAEDRINLDAICSLGNAQVSIQQYAEATENFNKVLKYHPDNFTATQGLAKIKAF